MNRADVFSCLSSTRAPIVFAVPVFSVVPRSIRERSALPQRTRQHFHQLVVSTFPKSIFSDVSVVTQLLRFQIQLRSTIGLPGGRSLRSRFHFTKFQSCCCWHSSSLDPVMLRSKLALMVINIRWFFWNAYTFSIPDSRRVSVEVWSKECRKCRKGKTRSRGNTVGE